MNFITKRNPTIYEDWKTKPRHEDRRGMGKIRGPRNWREDPGLMEAYEEVGRSIGRAILYDETMEVVPVSL